MAVVLDGVFISTNGEASSLRPAEAPGDSPGPALVLPASLASLACASTGISAALTARPSPNLPVLVRTLDIGLGLTLVQYYLNKLDHVCKDPISKNCHIHRFQVDVDFGGRCSAQDR